MEERGTNEKKEGRMNKKKEGRTNKKKEGKMNEKKGGRTNEKKRVSISRQEKDRFKVPVESKKKKVYAHADLAEVGQCLRMV